MTFLFLNKTIIYLHPMKFLAFIMAFLVLSLSFMPCADKESSTHEGKAKSELTKANNHHNDQQQNVCSPFCHCTCCGGFSINHFIAAISNIPLYETNLIITFLSAEIIEVAFPIWQPPQLV